jgi:hypothetical protein
MGLIVSCLAACSHAETKSSVSTQSNVSPSPSQAAEPGSSPTPNSPIRSVDFENFTYPEIDSRGKFTLKDGREPTDDDPRSLVEVIYGDVTGDEKEEALVVHSQSIRGSAIPYYVYIYMMESDKPKLLWSFYAGERGDGGLRQTYAESGELVTELYGKDRVVNGGASSEEDNVGVCCPQFFTRSRYEWRDGRFWLKGKEEAIPNPQGNAAYLPLLEGKDK